MNIQYLYKISKKTILDRSPVTYRDSKDGIGRMLLVVRTYKNTLLTVEQSIMEIVKNSRFVVDLVDINYAFPAISRKERDEYDVIVLHNTVTIPDGYLMNILGHFFFESYKGVKVVIKQDEHNRTNLVIDFLKRYKVNLLLSLWDENTSKFVYCRNNPDLHIMANCLTGYIPAEYKSLSYSLDNRLIDVGYRGIPFSPILGQLGYDKCHIGDEFLRHSRGYDINCDISSKFEDRIFGEKWLDFLGNCKFQLGVESGTDIVDIDGNIQKINKKCIRKYKTEDDMLKYMNSNKNNLSYRAISPRHFESIACKSVQILLEGSYQGILVPYRHYVPLKRDYSNIPEIMEYIYDDEKRKNIAECAYREIILNDKYSYENYVKRLDQSIKEGL